MKIFCFVTISQPVFQFINIQSLMTGHAFEGRIYAENVAKGFLPATGVLHHYQPVPVSSTGVQAFTYIMYEIIACFYLSI